MKNVLRKVCVSVLAMMIVIAYIPLGAYAEDEKEIKTLEMTYENPVFDSELTGGEEMDVADASGSTAESSITYTTIKGAGEYLRDQMKKKKSKVIIHYCMDKLPTTSMFRDIINEALKHTGVPDEGDYIKWQYAGWSASMTISRAAGAYILKITYNISYYTTLSQDNKADAAIRSALASLDLSGLSEYQKTKKIYKYICDHVKYDHDHGSTYMLKYTAYAAAVNKRAVCQGYAVLLYRMLLESGLDSRVICGTGSGSSHAWNIVRIGSKYYNLDSTWDAGRSTYKYFLKSDSNFSGHTRKNTNGIDYAGSTFYAAYPMSSSNYSSGSHDWESSYTVDKKATCTTSGTKSIHCRDCSERKNITTIPATGHSFEDVQITKQATLKETGRITGTCTKCGKESTETVARISSVKLSTAAYTYSGSRKAPSVTVKNTGGKKLTKGTDYTVTYEDGRVDVGKYKVTVKGIGKYSFTKTLYFKINPKGTGIKSVSAYKKAFKVKWTPKKDKMSKERVTGYQIRYSTKSSMGSAKLVTVTGYGKSYKKKTKLQAKKKYYVQVRTFMTVDGTKYYSSWSSKKSVKTK